MLLFKGHAAAGATQICVTCDTTQCSGDIWAKAAAEGNIWVHSPTKAMVYISVHGSCYFQRPWRCPTSGFPLGPQWCPRAILTLLPCVSRWPVLSHRAKVMYRSKVLLRVLSGPVILLQFGTVLMSVTHITTGAIGTMHDEIREPCWVGPTFC